MDLIIDQPGHIWCNREKHWEQIRFRADLKYFTSLVVIRSSEETASSLGLFFVML